MNKSKLNYYLSCINTQTSRYLLSKDHSNEIKIKYIDSYCKSNKKHILDPIEEAQNWIDELKSDNCEYLTKFTRMRLITLLQAHIDNLFNATTTRIVFRGIEHWACQQIKNAIFVIKRARKNEERKERFYEFIGQMKQEAISSGYDWDKGREYIRATRRLHSGKYGSFDYNVLRSHAMRFLTSMFSRVVGNRNPDQYRVLEYVQYKKCIELNEKYPQLEKLVIPITKFPSYVIKSFTNPYQVNYSFKGMQNV